MLPLRVLSTIILVIVLAGLTPHSIRLVSVTNAQTETGWPFAARGSELGGPNTHELTETTFSDSNFVQFIRVRMTDVHAIKVSWHSIASANLMQVPSRPLSAATNDSLGFPTEVKSFLLLRSDTADDDWIPRSKPAQPPVPGTPTPTPTPVLPETGLPAPTLSAASTNEAAVELQWTPVEGAANYELRVWWNGLQDWQLANEGNLQRTYFTHRERTTGTTYFYIVAALDSNGVRGAWSAQVEVTVREPDPPTPTPMPMPTATPTASVLPAPALNAEAGEDHILLTWEAVASADSYELIVWDRSSDEWRGIGGVLTGTSYTHVGITLGTEYYYHVRAVGGGISSPWSEYTYATVPQTPTPTVTVTAAPTLTPTSAITQEELAEERAALVALYEATDGANWRRNDNWLTDEPISAWFGIFTYESGEVSDLILENNQLRGSVPELAALTQLKSLRLAHNQLTGPIPELYAFTKLKRLHLHANRLSGPIPDLSALTLLTHLYLSGNELTGQIPDLAALTNLIVLDLGSNQLSGPIPALDALTNLRILSIHANQLNGSIPDLRALLYLTELNLGSNQLTGPIPVLNSFTNLSGLHLNDNRLSGHISDLNLLPSLKRLSLNGNRLTGNIPDLRSLHSLEDLDLSNNQLTGAIPDLNDLTNLAWLDLSHNRLTGQIPDITSLALLKGMLLNNNRLSGPVPELGTLADLLWLDLKGNKLSGPILDLNVLTNLQGLILSHNLLSGPVPDLGALSDLTWLDLRDNQLCLPSVSIFSFSNRIVSSHLERLNLATCADGRLSALPAVTQSKAKTVRFAPLTLTWYAVADTRSSDLRK